MQVFLRHPLKTGIKYFQGVGGLWFPASAGMMTFNETIVP
jgi:hypothetical protein